MQAARNFITAATEFATGVKHRKYDFDSGNSGLMVDSHRNASAVIRYGNGIVLMNRHFDMITGTGQGFIYGVVHNLIHKMMKAP